MDPTHLNLKAKMYQFVDLFSLLATLCTTTATDGDDGVVVVVQRLHS